MEVKVFFFGGYRLQAKTDPSVYGLLRIVPVLVLIKIGTVGIHLILPRFQVQRGNQIIQVGEKIMHTLLYSLQIQMTLTNGTTFRMRVGAEIITRQDI